MIAVSLFDKTGAMLEPWHEAGFECWALDVQHQFNYDNGGVTEVKPNFYKLHYDLSRPWMPPFSKDKIAFVSAFPPCDHLAVSGARWFKGKGLRKLAQSIELFATAAEFCEWANAPYLIENPVSNISSHWRKPDHNFHPWHFTGYESKDNYTKKTCLWTGGGFMMPEPDIDNELGEPDNRIHACPPGPERANFRSMTPKGFAKAVYIANTQKKDVQLSLLEHQT